MPLYSHSPANKMSTVVLFWFFFPDQISLVNENLTSAQFTVLLAPSQTLALSLSLTHSHTLTQKNSSARSLDWVFVFLGCHVRNVPGLFTKPVKMIIWTASKSSLKVSIA